MGRGDKKTKKGKIASGSFGNTRKQRVKSDVTAVSAPKAKAVAEKKPKKTVAKKAKEETSADA